MKIIFAGTPEFAVPALQALIVHNHQQANGLFEIVQVLTQPDRPAGRGMQLKASPVKQLALQHNLPVFQPISLKPAEVQAQIAAANADVMIVAAYGLIIPTPVLNMFALGCYNIHASLLPRWRGAAPIHRALLAGDAATGVTIMEVVPALDAGDMICKSHLPITAADTTQTLHDALSQQGAGLMLKTMQDLQKINKNQLLNGFQMANFAPKKLPAEKQDESLVTYAHKLEKIEAAIDWQKSAVEISRQVRGFNPFPVATAQFRGETCRIWFATATDGAGKAGEIIGLQGSILVACGQGAVSITELQMPGGKRQTAQQFAQGQHLQLGEMFS